MSVLFKYPLNKVYCAESSVSITDTAPPSVVAPSTLNLIFKYLTVFSFKEYLSIICTGILLYEAALNSLVLGATLSAFTKLSTIGLKSYIPAPALFGVVLKAPTFIEVAKFIVSVPI